MQNGAPFLIRNWPSAWEESRFPFPDYFLEVTSMTGRSALQLTTLTYALNFLRSPVARPATHLAATATTMTLLSFAILCFRAVQSSPKFPPSSLGWVASSNKESKAALRVDHFVSPCVTYNHKQQVVKDSSFPDDQVFVIANNLPRAISTGKKIHYVICAYLCSYLGRFANRNSELWRKRAAAGWEVRNKMAHFRENPSERLARGPWNRTIFGSVQAGRFESAHVAMCFGRLGLQDAAKKLLLFLSLFRLCYHFRDRRLLQGRYRLLQCVLQVILRNHRSLPRTVSWESLKKVYFVRRK